MVKEKDEAIQRQSKLEKKIHELERQGTIKIHKKGDGDISILPSPPPGVEGTAGSVIGGNAAAVGPNHVGVVAGSCPPPPPPPPPLPSNGTCRFDVGLLVCLISLMSVYGALFLVFDFVHTCVSPLSKC